MDMMCPRRDGMTWTVMKIKIKTDDKNTNYYLGVEGIHPQYACNRLAVLTLGTRVLLQNTYSCFIRKN